MNLLIFISILTHILLNGIYRGHHPTTVIFTHGGPVFYIRRIVPHGKPSVVTIVRGILDGWIYRHDPPNLILSEQGPNVDVSEITTDLAMHGIKKKRSSPYHPEGDGQSERGVFRQ